MKATAILAVVALAVPAAEAADLTRVRRQMHKGSESDRARRRTNLRHHRALDEGMSVSFVETSLLEADVPESKASDAKDSSGKKGLKQAAFSMDFIETSPLETGEASAKKGKALKQAAFSMDFVVMSPLETDEPSAKKGAKALKQSQFTVPTLSNDQNMLTIDPVEMEDDSVNSMSMSQTSRKLGQKEKRRRSQRRRKQ